MKLKIVLFALMFCTLVPVFGQTKLIAYKSHSGNKKHFKLMLENKLFDSGNANFGDVPIRFVTESKLDTVKFISDSVSVMVTSVYCQENYVDQKSLWNAGTDMLIHHPLFSKKHAKDSIKRVIDNEYYFRNPADSVVFIGFDNKNQTKDSEAEESKEENRIVPFIDTPKPPNHINIGLGILLIMLFSLVSALFFSRYHRNKMIQ